MGLNKNFSLTPTKNEHNLHAYLEHFEYIKGLVSIDHISFGPDTICGGHVDLHHYYTKALLLKASKTPQAGMVI